MNKPKKLFIVEGVNREVRFVNALSLALFKGKYEIELVVLPADKNIYMLYNLLKDDNFDSDIVEVLRDNVEIAAKTLEGVTRQDIDEVFLFFDFDAHQNNLNLDYGVSANDAIFELINFFDNETEEGKLYINYPMVEALYDFVENTCVPFSSCKVSISELKSYKQASGENNPCANLRFDNHEEWEKVLEVFGLRLQCLFDYQGFDYKYYCENITVHNIFLHQLAIINTSQEIFVLSAFPEFLLDYFGEKFFVSHIKRILIKEKMCNNC